MENSSDSNEKREFWRLALIEYEKSGLSIRAFCQRENLSEPSFYAWRRKLEKQAGTQKKRSTGPKNNSDFSAKLVSVELVDGDVAKATGQDSLLEVVTRGGSTIRFNDSLSGDRLKSVLVSVMQAEVEDSRC